MLAVQAKGIHSAFESGHMAMVVSTPDIDYFVISAYFKFIAVIGNIGSKVCVKTVGTAKHVVLQLKLCDFSR